MMRALPGLVLHGAIVIATWAAPDISSIPADLELPTLASGKPAAGKRVKQTQPRWKDSQVYHVLYLPGDWKEGETYPVIVEYAGNGYYRNKFGDISTGHPEKSKMGYGISGGKGFIWLCLPYLSNDGKRNVTKWWGDRPTYNPKPTLDYAKATVPWVCKKYGGDPDKVFLCGFSRGAIACNFIGLHDDEIAGLWCAFLPYSHYDGVIERWGYPEADRRSALARLRRLGNRPQFITQEGSTAKTQAWLAQSGIKANLTFRETGFRNHNDAWLLRPTPVRMEIRTWVKEVLKDGNP